MNQLNFAKDGRIKSIASSKTATDGVVKARIELVFDELNPSDLEQLPYGEALAAALKECKIRGEGESANHVTLSFKVDFAGVKVSIEPPEGEAIEFLGTVVGQPKGKGVQGAGTLTVRIDSDLKLEQFSRVANLVAVDALYLTIEGSIIDVISEPTSDRAHIVTLLQDTGQEMNAQDIAEHFPDMTVASIRTNLMRAVKSGEVHKVKRGIYSAIGTLNA